MATFSDSSRSCKGGKFSDTRRRSIGKAQRPSSLAAYLDDFRSDLAFSNALLLTYNLSFVETKEGFFKSPTLLTATSLLQVTTRYEFESGIDNPSVQPVDDVAPAEQLAPQDSAKLFRCAAFGSNPAAVSRARTHWAGTRCKRDRPKRVARRYMNLWRQYDMRDDVRVGAPQSQNDLALGVDPFR